VSRGIVDNNYIIDNISDYIQHAARSTVHRIRRLFRTNSRDIFRLCSIANGKEPTVWLSERRRRIETQFSAE